MAKRFFSSRNRPKAVKTGQYNINSINILALYSENVQELWGGWIDGLACIFKGQDGNLCKEYLPNITCPTLIIHGEKDPLVPRFHPEYIHKNIKNSSLIMMPEGRHNLHLRFPEEFNQYVANFCDKQ